MSVFNGEGVHNPLVPRQLPKELLTRGYTNGYNYVLFSLNFGWLADRVLDDDPNVWPNYAGFHREIREYLTEVFKQIDSSGMKPIPSIACGSRWDYHWMYVSDVELNEYGVDEVGAPSGVRFASTPLSPSDMKTDSVFRSVMNTVRSAYEDANLLYPLEYVHLGHDELYTVETFSGNQQRPRILIGDGSVAHSSKDRDYVDSLMSASNTIETAIQKTMAQEIYARISAVKDVFGSETKVMIWADMWDPQHNGSQASSTYKNIPGSLNPTLIRIAPAPYGIATLPGLTATQKTLVRNNLILMPWVYSYGIYGHYYDADETFKYFSENGFKIVYSSMFVESEATSISVNSSMPVRNYVNAASRYREHVLGYSAANWSPSYINPNGNTWKSIEYLRKSNRPDFIHSIINQ